MRATLVVVLAALAVTATSAAAPQPPANVTAIPLSVAAFPDGALAAAGAVWIESHREASLYRIDPAANAVKRYALSAAQCFPLTYGGSRIWYSSCYGITGIPLTYGFKPSTRNVVVRATGGAATYAGGSVWEVDAKGRLLRTDTRTGVVLRRIKLRIAPAPNGQSAGSGCGDSLWTPNGVDAVQRTSLATNRTHVIPLPGGHDADGTGYFGVNNVGCAAGKVWVPTGAGLYEVDPATEDVTLLPLAISSFDQQGDVGIASDGDTVYLRTSNTEVVQIDGKTAKVTGRFPASGGGGGIAVAAGSLWVVNAGDGTVWREPLP
jgi:streptogramin lyase